MKRRKFLKSITAASLATLAVNRSGLAAGHDKGQKADEQEHVVDYLFVQNARAVSLQDGTLTLKGAAVDTLYFSDRPDRIVGRITTKKFVEKWAVGDDSFAKEPPNAVLSIHHEPIPQDVVVVLRNPRLDGADLIYEAEVLDGEKTATGDGAALFIDVIGRPLTPVSIAGANRRERRRDRRDDRRDDR